MVATSCDYCRLPFKVRRVMLGQPNYCCTGCALASRIPVDAKGDFPINSALLSALATAFVLFNQILFWLLAVLLEREGNTAMADRFLWLASAAAWLLLLVIFGLVLKARTGRVGDWILLAGVLAVYTLAHRQLPPEPIGMAAASAVLLLWNARGLLRKKLV